MDRAAISEKGPSDPPVGFSLFNGRQEWIVNDSILGPSTLHPGKRNKGLTGLDAKCLPVPGLSDPGVGPTQAIPKKHNTHGTR